MALAVCVGFGVLAMCVLDTVLDVRLYYTYE